MRKLTVLQSRLIAEVLYDEQMFLAKINGCEVQESNAEEHTDFSEGFQSMRRALGNGF